MSFLSAPYRLNQPSYRPQPAGQIGGKLPWGVFSRLARRVPAAAKKTLTGGRKALTGPKKPKVPKTKKPKAPESKKKQLGKKVAKAAAGAAVGMAGEAAMSYALHKMMGGPELTKTEMKKAALDAGLGMANRGLNGEASTKMVREEFGRAFNKQLNRASATRGRKHGMAPMDAMAVMKEMKKLHRFAKQRGRTKRYRLYKGRIHNTIAPRAFGSGAGGRRNKKGKKNKKSKKKKKKKKKKGKKKKKSTKRKGGLKAMNVPALRRKYFKMQDVFTSE